MAVVTVQSKATSHVYRLFGALVVLLVLMGLTLALTRLRSEGRSGSPYGSLNAAVPVEPAPQQAAAVAPTPPQTAAAPAPSPAVAGSQVMAFADPAPKATSLMAVPTPPPVARPPAAAPLADPGAPRQIALDKAAAVAVLPQPAPAAVVQAALKAAATARVTPPAPVPVITPAPAPAAAPATSLPPVAKVASLQRDDTRDDAAPGPSKGGRVNINTASIEQLNHVGGGMIGAAIARRRPYRSIQDLVSHRVLKARDFARIQAAISAE